MRESVHEERECDFSEDANGSNSGLITVKFAI
jgi:hypothetical protein